MKSMMTPRIQHLSCIVWQVQKCNIKCRENDSLAHACLAHKWLIFNASQSAPQWVQHQDQGLSSSACTGFLWVNWFQGHPVGCLSAPLIKRNWICTVFMSEMRTNVTTNLYPSLSPEINVALNRDAASGNVFQPCNCVLFLRRIPPSAKPIHSCLREHAPACEGFSTSLRFHRLLHCRQSKRSHL